MRMLTDFEIISVLPRDRRYHAAFLNAFKQPIHDQEHAMLANTNACARNSISHWRL